MTGFYVPSSFGESEIVEKRSRFLGHICKVDTEEEAKIFIQSCKKQFHDARHNCWCYRIYDGPERFSDDGEPQGSAGMPMMEILRYEKVYNVVCVVTRYFGGVLLGTGGLSRAYSSAAKEALQSAGIAVIGEWAEIRFSCSYSSFDRIKKEICDAGGYLDRVEYGSDINISALLPYAAERTFCSFLKDSFSGSIIPSISGPVLRQLNLN